MLTRTLLSAATSIVICWAPDSRLPLSVNRSPLMISTSVTLAQLFTRLRLTRGWMSSLLTTLLRSSHFVSLRLHLLLVTISLSCHTGSSPHPILFELSCAEAMCGLIILLFMILSAVCLITTVPTCSTGSLSSWKSTYSWIRFVMPWFLRSMTRLPYDLSLFAGREPRGCLQFLGLESGSVITYIEERSEAKRSSSVLGMAKYRHFRDVLVADLRRAQCDH